MDYVKISNHKLNVKPITDGRALRKLKSLDAKVRKGKRKTYSKEEFLDSKKMYEGDIRRR
jgi:hypothetical protein